MNLIKTSLFNGIAVVIKIISYFFINKILAVLIGPSGFVVIGQFQNAIQMISAFASGAINNGVTKYTAENAKDEKEQIKVWRTAGSIVIAVSLIFSLLVILCRHLLSLYFFKNDEYSYLFTWLAGTLLFFNLNILLLAILSGKKEVKSYVLANIAGSILTLLTVGLMSYFWQLKGALISLVIYQSIAFFVTSLICQKKTWFKIKYLYGQIDKQVLKKLVSYAFMAFTSALMVPISQMLIRSTLVTKFSIDIAGCWEGLNRLSSAGLMVATTTLSLYYLPRLSELDSKKEIKEEIIEGIKIILPVSLLTMTLLFFFRETVINILFSKSFAQMKEMFFWQMLGDLVKIVSWLFAYVVLAKAYVKIFIFAEIFFSLSLYVLFDVMSFFKDIHLITFAYFINYVFYLLFLLFCLRKKGFFD